MVLRWIGILYGVSTQPWPTITSTTTSTPTTILRIPRLSESFAGTAGFVVRFNRQGLADRVRTHPQVLF